MGVPAKVSVELRIANGELPSYSDVSVILSGLKNRVLDAVLGQLLRFLENSPLVYAAVVPLNIPFIFIAAAGFQLDRPVAVKSVAPKNIFDISVTLVTFHPEILPLKVVPSNILAVFRTEGGSAGTEVIDPLVEISLNAPARETMGLVPQEVTDCNKEAPAQPDTFPNELIVP